MRKPALALTLVLALTACASPTSPDAVPHGYVEGASEAAEPQLTIATIDARGEVALLDLLTGDSVTVTSLDDVTDTATDGRFVFATVPSGVSIIDSGVWTVDHEDHFHYYRAEPRVIGTVAGEGAASVTGRSPRVTIAFASGETVVLDAEALADGDIVEVERSHVEPGSVVATVGSEIVVARPSGEISGSSTNCPAPAGTITTRVGTVIGCSDGAVLITETLDVEHIPAPSRATSFDNRAGRPTTAALAGGDGYWLLDTREREWMLTRTASPLARVTAVDDAEEHVVALTTDGRVQVWAHGELLATTERLTSVEASTTLTVDASRAYLNDISGSRVLEIDYADSARVAREFPFENAPLHLEEVGR